MASQSISLTESCFINSQLLILPLLASILDGGHWVIVTIAIVAIVFYTINRRNKMTHETLRTMIDKGVPLTPEMIAAVKPFQGTSERSRRDLRSGVILAAVGMGLVMFVGRPGYIVLFLGAAFLLLSGRRSVDSSRGSREAIRIWPTTSHRRPSYGHGGNRTLIAAARVSRPGYSASPIGNFVKTRGRRKTSPSMAARPRNRVPARMAPRELTYPKHSASCAIANERRSCFVVKTASRTRKPQRY